MKVARSALHLPPRPLGEGRGEGNGHSEQRLSWSGVALVAMAFSEGWMRSPGRWGENLGYSGQAEHWVGCPLACTRSGISSPIAHLGTVHE